MPTLMCVQYQTACADVPDPCNCDRCVLHEARGQLAKVRELRNLWAAQSVMTRSPRLTKQGAVAALDEALGGPPTCPDCGSTKTETHPDGEGGAQSFMVHLDGCVQLEPVQADPA